MMMTNNKRLNKGFSLIEVMLATLVLAIGILSVSKLQTSLLRSGSDANNRSIAAAIGQRKIDDLRRFTHLTTTRPDIPDSWANTLSPTSLAFTHITSNTGGLIDNATTTVGNIEYTVSWSVSDYYYSALNMPATTSPVAGSTHPDFKMASIIVSWDDVGGDRKNVTLDTVIEARSPAFTGLGEDSGSAGYAPIAKYSPQSAPDVVPITIDADGVKKETNKPLPELSNKENSTEVLFETVTYNLDKDTLRREEFRTLACNCKNSGTLGTVRKGLTTWDSVNQVLLDYVVTSTGPNAEVDYKGDASSISPNCRFCCLNGREGNGVSTDGFQVCRLKRVDGILRVFAPWKMVAFNMVPASYFNDDSSGLSGMTSVIQASNISTYSNYVTSLVRNLLRTHSSSTTFNASPTIDTSLPSITNSYVNGVITHTNINGINTIRPLQARALYMDYPPNGVYEDATYTATNVPLDRISFYEVNMTQLAGWIPDKNDTFFDTDYTTDDDGKGIDELLGHDTHLCLTSGANCVTNQVLVDGGNYSRGEFYANSPTTTTVTSRLFTSNDGVVNKKVTETTTFDSIDVVLEISVQ